jgi:hypothetical protein
MQDHSRRNFLTSAAGIAAGGAVLASAVVPPIAEAAPQTDAMLLDLERRILNTRRPPTSLACSSNRWTLSGAGKAIACMRNMKRVGLR